MSEMLTRILIYFGFTSFMGWIMLFTGIGTCRKKRNREETETSRTTGRIAEYIRKESRSSKGSASFSLKPVIEFDVYGKHYRLEYENHLDQKDYPVDASVEILYDLSDPVHFHLETDSAYVNGGRNAVRIGCIWIAVSAALTLALAVFVGGASLREIGQEVARFFGF